MPLRKIIGLSVLAACLAAASWWSALAVFAWVHGPAPATEPPAPTRAVVAGLSVPVSALDLGEVWETDAFKVALPITNVSGKDISVTDILAGCACVEASPRAFSVKAGETKEVALTIDLTKRGPWERHAAHRPFKVTVVPVIEKVGMAREAWVLSMAVPSRITLDTDELAFGDRTVSGQENDPRRIEACVHGSSAMLEARVIPPTAGTATVEPMGEGRFKVAVAPSASLPEGPFKFHVELTASGGEGEPSKAVRRFEAKGTLRPEVRAFPAQVFLGPRTVGTTAATTVQLQSPPGAGWEVERIECDSADVKVVAQEGGAYRVEMAAKAGDFAAKVRFFVRKGKTGSAMPVEMVVACFGTKKETKP
ncbi:MAG: hypothetical protein K2W96_14145 [Gemmataceae bacterium]|nr:hypothetical protein [Gemmataceae bacterium]